MKIGNVSQGKGPSSVKRKPSKNEGGATFAETLKEAGGASETAAPVEAAPVHSVDAVLAMQESDDATDHRSRGLVRQYGDNLLDRLDSLRHDLLIGQVPKSRLADLAQSMRSQRARCTDEKLMAIIDEIELRCEVEIAKLTRRP